MRTLRYASLGFLLGFAWGVVARVWMRLITTAPEFSWVGTRGIIGTAGFAGLIAKPIDVLTFPHQVLAYCKASGGP